MQSYKKKIKYARICTIFCKIFAFFKNILYICLRISVDFSVVLLYLCKKNKIVAEKICIFHFFFVTLCPKSVCIALGMENDIRHRGIVEQVNGDMVVVRIAQTSACSACHAAKMCMASESREKRIEAQMLRPLKVGDEVEVIVREQAGWLAVCLAYIIPFLLLVAAVAGFAKIGWSEAKAGTAALVSVAVYYVVLRLFRDKLQRKFTFYADKV